MNLTKIVLCLVLAQFSFTQNSLAQIGLFGIQSNMSTSEVVWTLEISGLDCQKNQGYAESYFCWRDDYHAVVLSSQSIQFSCYMWDCTLSYTPERIVENLRSLGVGNDYAIESEDYLEKYCFRGVLIGYAENICVVKNDPNNLRPWNAGVIVMGRADGS